MKILGVIKRIIKNRFFVSGAEKTFMNKVKRAINKYNADHENVNDENKKNGYFFIETAAVNQTMCFSQGLFGKGGEAEGLKPVVVMTRFVRKHKDTFLSMGIKNVEIKFLNINILDVIKGYLWANSEYKKIKSFDDLLNLSYKDMKIGEFIYSSYLFNYMTGTIHSITPELKKYLRTCYFHYVYYEKLYNKYNPKFLVATNSTYIPCGILFQLAMQRNIPAYVAVWPTSNEVSIKRFDNNNNLDDLCVANPSPTEWKFINKERKKEWLDKGKAWMERRFRGEDSSFGGGDTAVGKPWIPKDEVLKMLGIDRNKKVILVCSHVMWDDPFIYKNIFRDYYWWWVETAKMANDIEDVVWIFKSHPGEMDTIGRKTDQVPIRSLDVLKNMNLKPHIKFLDSGLKFNNYSLMQIIDAVVTVRGTIGIEYACAGIPVINAGTGPYTCADFAVTCRTIPDYQNALKNIKSLERLPQDKIDRALLFAYFYLAGKLSTTVKGTPDEHDITKLKDSFYEEFKNCGEWKEIIANIKNNKDCRKVV